MELYIPDKLALVCDVDRALSEYRPCIIVQQTCFELLKTCRKKGSAAF